MPLLLVFLSGCVHAPLNKILTEDAAPKQLHFVPRPAETADDDVAIFLFFSGGGTRAAAFSYGVLKELSRTHRSSAQPRHHLLDDVDSIAAVSGGSFTAAYYCLYHDRIFQDFESRFLKRNVQGALALRVLNPVVWPKLWSPYYGRSDMVAEYYDRNIFDGAKFSDLLKAGGRPYLAINATDMATGEQFVFNDTRFALISSDLNDYPIARAVAASSAVSLVLTPLTLRNFAGAPGAAKSSFVPRNAEQAKVSHEEAQVLDILHSYFDSKSRPFIHLADGGYSDNLGLQSFVDDSVALGGIPQLLKRGGMRAPKHLVLIVVNSSARRGDEWNRQEAVPGFLRSLLALGDQSGLRENYRSIKQLQDALEGWKKEERAAHPDSSVSPDYYLIPVGFDAIKDETERSFFMNLLTTFSLPGPTVDRLVKAGGDILHDSPEFKRLLNDLEVSH
jgi:NTE family protein